MIPMLFPILIVSLSASLEAVDQKTQMEWLRQNQEIQDKINAKRLEDEQLQGGRVEQQIQDDKLEQQRIQRQIIERKLEDQRWYDRHH